MVPPLPDSLVFSGPSESYDQFKINIHSLFPVLIDTKNVTKDIWKVVREGHSCGVSGLSSALSQEHPLVQTSSPLTLSRNSISPEPLTSQRSIKS